MLHEAKELQIAAVNELYSQLNYKDILTFRAPTGSGKTYMMADFMNQVLSKRNDVIFLVSSLSKGNLAEQNYNKFLEYNYFGNFSELNPYLISTETSGEERLFIPTDYNVYLLPRDLYKKGGRLMQGAMESFLQFVTYEEFLNGLGKKVYLIKDECHIATNNLDSLSSAYFTKVINFSATPKLRRGQHPDVEITDAEAENVKLIKRIELGSEENTVADAINKFEEVKASYRDLLGVNPCLIIQISNKDKADEELNNIILPELNKVEHQDLKWMLIVNKNSECDTNDVFKAKKLPVSRWKEYAKENTSGIDIIIFKMVISEGWDIPRACMLYQMRDSHSKQLDEQVMGRVRRNPRLLDFETLTEEAQKLAMTAWIWGLVPENKNKVLGVRLWDGSENITNSLKLKTTKLKSLTQKEDFNLEDFISHQRKTPHKNNIFELYRKLEKSDCSIQQMCYSYAEGDISKWWDFTEKIDEISKESNKYFCDYSKSMELVVDDNGEIQEKSVPMESSFIDNGNYINISDWVWRRKDGKSRFSFDSNAEKEWADILKDLASSDTFLNDGKRVAKRVATGKINPNKDQIHLTGEIEPERIDQAKKYLWGKNYIPNSEIKFEYCLGGVHSSYPDFIMMDSFERIHIFEVKSVNKSNAVSSSFDSADYEEKITELKKCYKQASILTGHIFYLPMLRNDEWYITQIINGDERNLTLSQFEIFLKKEPK
jgi:type III restriction enzyme